MQPWQQALLHGGLGVLGGNQNLSTGQLLARGIYGGLQGAQAAKQSGQQERAGMMELQRLQSQLQDAALQRRAMVTDMENAALDRKKQQGAALGRQGHIESLAAGKSPQEQAMLFLNPDQHVENQMAANAPLSSIDQAKLDQDQSQFNAGHGLDRQKLGLVREEMESNKALAEQGRTSDQAAQQQEQDRYQAVAAELDPGELPAFWADPKGYVEERNKAEFKGDAGGKLSGEQRKSLLLGDRASKALAQVDEALAGGYDPTSIWSAATGLNKKTQSQGGQTFDRAFRDASTAILRLESGAVIGEDEVKQFEQTFKPSTGDTAETAKQKMAAFKDYVANVQSMATATTATAGQAQQPAPIAESTQQEQQAPAADYSSASDDEIRTQLKDLFGG